jgi:hypothetical protein
MLPYKFGLTILKKKGTSTRSKTDVAAATFRELNMAVTRRVYKKMVSSSAL